jgi:hypothetical protein
MTRSFSEWWNAIPSNLKEKTRERGEGNKQSLDQLNHTLLHPIFDSGVKPDFGSAPLWYAV